jgi:hypothetical protein
MKFNPTTPIKFYAKDAEYVPGQGSSTEWNLIESIIKPATETEPEETVSVFYCEWKGSFGDRAIAAQAVGVNDSATIRTFYNPDIYAALQTLQTVVIKNADNTAIVDGVPDHNNQNCYELWGGVDNIAEENQFIEFRVRRYEGK